MSEPRFYCEDLKPGLLTLDEAESRHALQSLRLESGDPVVLFDGHGRHAHGVLQSSEQPARRRAIRRAMIRVEHVICEPAPEHTLTLIIAGCKGPRLTWMIEKLTELGTTGIVIAKFKHSVVRVGESHARKLRRTALEAAKQSQRMWLPKISCGLTLAEFIRGRKRSAGVNHHDRRIPQAGNVSLVIEFGGDLLIAHPADDAPMLGGRLPARELRQPHLTAVVGPEGGLAEEEVEMLQQVGGEVVRLADHILRIETAAIAIASNWAARQPD